MEQIAQYDIFNGVATGLAVRGSAASCCKYLALRPPDRPRWFQPL